MRHTCAKAGARAPRRNTPKSTPRAKAAANAAGEGEANLSTPAGLTETPGARLALGNSYKWVDGDLPHEWTVFVRDPEDVREGLLRPAAVLGVTFHLHPDFNPCKAQLPTAPAM